MIFSISALESTRDRHRFYAYFNTPSFLVLSHIMFDTTPQIPEVEFEVQSNINTGPEGQ